MEDTTNKARIYNVVILDKSGSMNTIARQAITGVNETFASIRSQQLKDPELDNRVTLVVFCGCETRVLMENTPIADVQDITEADYRPCCMTPLYDAVGSTLTRLRRETEGERCSVAVTIVTDGYENASREFSHQAVVKLIGECRELGWMIAYIGADHDVERVARELNIANAMRFDKTAAGTSAAFATERKSRANWASKIKKHVLNGYMSVEEAQAAMREESEDYFG